MSNLIKLVFSKVKNFIIKDILSCLDIILLDTPNETKDYSDGLTQEVWRQSRMNDNLGNEGTVTDLLARVYYGGVDHTIRQAILTS